MLNDTDIGAIWPVGELIQYCCALAVAEELHFTRAAQRLHLDQSAVSRHVQKLESKLGTQLFIRGERRIELTEAGNAFIPFARKSLLAAKAGVRVAQAIGRGEPQVFEVAYSPSVDIHLIAQIKLLVENARPITPIHLRSVPPDALIERLLAGLSHAGVSLLPVEEEIRTTCILREELLLAVPRTHRLAEAPIVKVYEIGEDPVVWPSGVYHSAFTNHVFGQFRRVGYVPNVSHDAQTTAEAIGLAREGLGISFLKTSDRPLIDNRLAVCKLNPPFVAETGLLHVPEREWDLLLQFMALVTTHFRCN